MIQHWRTLAALAENLDFSLLSIYKKQYNKIFIILTLLCELDSSQKKKNYTGVYIRNYTQTFNHILKYKSCKWA